MTEIVVEIGPYRERRIVRRLATGVLFGYLAGEMLAPLVSRLLTLILPADEADDA